MNYDFNFFGANTTWRRAMFLGLTLWGASVAHGRSLMQDALAAELPKFDPNAATTKPVADPKETKSRATLIRLPTTAATNERPAPSEGAKEVVVLPQVTVSVKSSAARSDTLPKLSVSPTVKDLPAVPFETPGARDERLVKKHLTKFDRLFLNRYTLPFLGISKEARAREMESVSATAASLDEVAEGIESSFWTGRNPEEKKKLKELYYDVYLSRPK